MCSFSIILILKRIDVLKSKNPCILLNKNINFNKNETKSKMENSIHSFREANLQLIEESHFKSKIARQTFVGLQDVFKTSSRHVLKTFSTRLQRNNVSSSKTSWRRFANTSWRHLARRLEDVLKTSWNKKNCYSEDVLKTSWRHVLKMHWRRLGEEQNVYWGYLYLTMAYQQI